jgi:multiple sugar transport system permease protein
VAIILLAGLQSIPPDLYAQGRIDGADRRQRFVKITMPLLKPFLVIALLFRNIDSLRIFDLVYVLTHGGPGGATTSISLYAYKYYIAGDFGYASAVSVVLFAVAFGLALVYVRLSRFRETMA